MRRTCVMACIALMVPVLASAQGTAAGSGSAATAGTTTVAQAASGSDDLQVVLSEPDFTLGALPTTLRLPKGKMAFRITHRFTYKINGSSVGDFFDNAFGFDSSATVGFELRYGLASGTQLSVHRTNSQNIQFMAQHQVRQQGSTGRFSADVLMALEGQDNFREEHSIVVGGVFSHKFDEKGAVYVEPMGVFNATPEFPSSDRNTMVLGLGARLRIAKSKAYVVAEFAPRLGGYDGGSSLMTFGIEKRMGGHSFQLNVSNAFGTTLTQVGHGGPDPRHWHLGFNLSRKFY